jgi:hypothetical protein
MPTNFDDDSDDSQEDNIDFGFVETFEKESDSTKWLNDIEAEDIPI